MQSHWAEKEKLVFVLFTFFFPTCSFYMQLLGFVLCFFFFFPEKCACFKPIVSPQGQTAFFVVVPFHMICPVYSAHGQEQSTRSCWQRKHICIMSVLILPKRVVNRKEKQPVQLLQDVTRKHLWQPHPSNCCYRNFSYLYPLYDLDFS